MFESVCLPPPGQIIGFIFLLLISMFEPSQVTFNLFPISRQTIKSAEFIFFTSYSGAGHWAVSPEQVLECRRCHFLQFLFDQKKSKRLGSLSNILCIVCFCLTAGESGVHLPGHLHIRVLLEDRGVWAGVP